MPKPKKPSRKELLKEPEAIQTLQEKALEWLAANQKTAAIVAGVLIVAVALLVGVRKWGAYQEAQAMALYGQAKVEVAADGTPRPETVPQALEALKAVAEKYPNTKAARFSQLERANLLYSQGRAQEAARLYEESLSRWKANDDLGLLAKHGLAYSKLAANDLTGAQKLFQELAAQGFGAGAAQLQLGLILERQGKTAEAVAAYQKAAKEAKGPEAELAKTRLEVISPDKDGGA